MSEAFRLRYILGKTTSPVPGSIGILVFDTLDHAAAFTLKGIVLECEYVGPIIKVPVIIHTHSRIGKNRFITNALSNIRSSRKRRINVLKKMFVDGKDIEIYKNNNMEPYSNLKSYELLAEAPTGTNSVRMVKPLKVVYDGRFKQLTN